METRSRQRSEIFSNQGTETQHSQGTETRSSRGPDTEQSGDRDTEQSGDRDTEQSGARHGAVRGQRHGAVGGQTRSSQGTDVKAWPDGTGRLWAVRLLRVRGKAALCLVFCELQQSLCAGMITDPPQPHFLSEFMSGKDLRYIPCGPLSENACRSF
ncbi:unnamed protein product [Arctogadus glacialis]